MCLRNLFLFLFFWKPDGNVSVTSIRDWDLSVLQGYLNRKAVQSLSSTAPAYVSPSKCECIVEQREKTEATDGQKHTWLKCNSVRRVRLMSDLNGISSCTGRLTLTELVGFQLHKLKKIPPTFPPPPKSFSWVHIFHLAYIACMQTTAITAHEKFEYKWKPQNINKFW